MALILNIDTAIDSASICLAQNGNNIVFISNEKQKDHAAWMHMAIKEMFKKNDSDIKSLDAVAVSGGPGSYTGLRIGFAAAKGICYALKKKLITVGSLEIMANSAKNSNYKWLCPMIDARRMEVYTAIYTNELGVIKEPAALILNENSFTEELALNQICFFGNGSNKFRTITKNRNAHFENINNDATNMISLSENKYKLKEFADIAYSEPLYLKEFYTPAK